MAALEPSAIRIEAGSAEEGAGLSRALASEIAAAFAPRDERALVLVARDAGGASLGGLVGSTHWRWGYVRVLWVAPACRGRGIGARLLAGAGTEVLARGAVGLYVDTFDPRAVAFYERHGFRRIGAIADFPPGHARTVLVRRLDREAVRPA